MNNQASEPIPNDFILLKSTTNSAEAITITGLLEAHSIKTYTTSEGGSAVTGRLDGPLPLYKIFVNQQTLADARKLIDSNNEIPDYEWRKYRQRDDRKSASWGRIVGLLIAGLFYALSLLPMKESHKMMKYILVGASLCCILLVLLSFYRGKENNQKY